MPEVVVPRKLTNDEARAFADEITRVPGITGYLVHELQALPHVLVVESGGEAAGILAYTEAATFVELKLLIVQERFRGRGYAKVLFSRFTKLFRGTAKPTYAVTKNEAVKHLLETNGYRHVSFWMIPAGAKLHQLAFALSAYRAREFLRKRVAFPGSGAFGYWIRRPQR